MSYGKVSARGRDLSAEMPSKQPKPSRKVVRSRRDARFMRAAGDFETAWFRNGGELDDNATFEAAVARVLAGSETFPREVYVAARRVERARQL